MMVAGGRVRQKAVDQLLSPAGAGSSAGGGVSAWSAGAGGSRLSASAGAGALSAGAAASGVVSTTEPPPLSRADITASAIEVQMKATAKIQVSLVSPVAWPRACMLPPPERSAPPSLR